jgi:hypothetical protein
MASSANVNVTIPVVNVTRAWPVDCPANLPGMGYPGGDESLPLLASEAP